jgi:carotenoid cleavage dioxygenase-like enzyme
VRHDSLTLGYGDRKEGTTTLNRLTLALRTKRVTNERLADYGVEFPRINDRREALVSRFVYVPTKSESLTLQNQPSAVFNAILKVDTDTGIIERHDLGNRIAGEPVFIPKADKVGEDDGYLAVYAYDPDAMTSDLVLLDARRIGAEPIVVIRLPQRVPQGLHGAWIPK